MLDDTQSSAGVISRVLSQFPTRPATSDEQMLDNIRSAVSRKLPWTVGQCKPHDKALTVAAGGPSLQDTYKDMRGPIAAVNGSLAFLMERDIKPWACGVLDPGDHMHGIIEPVPGVFYFVASCCHPSTFDHLIGNNCDVILWHATGLPGAAEAAGNPDLMISGGSTMGLRWINLGLTMGFRKFHLHGLDSSFRGDSTHAYPDRRDGAHSVEINGRQTTLNFLQQVQDFFLSVETIKRDGLDVAFNVHGDGLLQDEWRKVVNA
jgi:hypothetical protein